MRETFPCAADGHCCGCLSRRQFLRTAAAGALGLGLGGSARLWAAPRDLAETIPVQTLRPRPRVRIAGAVVRYPPPYWLGWPGTSYDVEGKRQEYLDLTRQAARRLQLRLDLAEKPLEDDNAIKAFVEKLQAEKPDGVVLILQHIGVWPWAERIAGAGVPTLVFSPIGTSFTGHIASFSRRTGVHVVSSLDFGAVEMALRMIRAKRMFEESRILVVAGQERNETVLDTLGTKVRYLPRRVFPELFEAMPVTEEVRALAEAMRREAQRIVEPTEQDRLNAARVYTTAKRLLKDESANAITMDCLGMVAGRVVPTPPCMAWSALQDQGITAGCEADLFGAVSLMLTSYLLDKPGFMNDPVAETAKNLLIAAHCTCGTRLNGFAQPREPYILRSHSESNIGVSMQVLWRKGQRVTLVRFEGPSRLILDTGTVVGNVDTPPAGGCRTSFEIQMDQVEDSRDVLGFHQVVFYGDHRRDVEAFCQLYGLEVVHSPEKSG